MKFINSTRPWWRCTALLSSPLLCLLCAPPHTVAALGAEMRAPRLAVGGSWRRQDLVGTSFVSFHLLYYVISFVSAPPPEKSILALYKLTKKERNFYNQPGGSEPPLKIVYLFIYKKRGQASILVTSCCTELPSLAASSQRALSYPEINILTF